MADTKVSELTAASAADGSELLHVVQVGNDRKMTTAQIAALVTSEVIDDRVAALLVAGTNITITYNDASGTLTIASTGGGSAGTPFGLDSTTAFTPDITHANSVIRMNNGSASVFNVPTNASVAYPTGTTLGVRQVGAGQVTVTPAGGVTINKPVSLTYKAREQGSSLMLHKVGTDEWDITGDLAAT